MIPKENLRSSYKFYRDYTDQPAVDLKIYLDVVQGFIKFIMSKVFQGIEVELSGGKSLGVLGIRGYKQKAFFKPNGEMKGYAVNWQATWKYWNENPEAKEKGVKIFHFNEHTNGIMYNFVWLKGDMKLVNRRFYNLCMSRTNKRTLSKLIQEGQEYIIEPDK